MELQLCRFTTVQAICLRLQIAVQQLQEKLLVITTSKFNEFWRHSKTSMFLMNRKQTLHLENWYVNVLTMAHWTSKNPKQEMQGFFDFLIHSILTYCEAELFVLQTLLSLRNWSPGNYQVSNPLKFFEFWVLKNCDSLIRSILCVEVFSAG